MEPKLNYFIIFNTTEGAYLGVHKQENYILTYPTLESARQAFEAGYQEFHSNPDPTWSASAAINWMNLKPFIVSFDGELDPLELLKILTNSQSPNLEVSPLSSAAVRWVKGVRVDLESCLKYKIAEIALIPEL